VDRSNRTVRPEPPRARLVHERLLSFQPAGADDAAAHGIGNGSTDDGDGIHVPMLAGAMRFGYADDGVGRASTA
jgi:hypothetical protein